MYQHHRELRELAIERARQRHELEQRALAVLHAKGGCACPDPSSCDARGTVDARELAQALFGEVRGARDPKVRRADKLLRRLERQGFVLSVLDESSPHPFGRRVYG